MDEIACALTPESFAAAPETATTVACRVVQVTDGDTIVVEVKQLYRVRLLDCWAPEIKGDEKEAGLQSREHLRNLIKDHGLDATLSVPWSEDAAKSWSMGRVLGNVWLSGQDKSLSEIQVAAGMATKVKQ